MCESVCNCVWVCYCVWLCLCVVTMPAALLPVSPFCQWFIHSLHWPSLTRLSVCPPVPAPVPCLSGLSQRSDRIGMAMHHSGSQPIWVKWCARKKKNETPEKRTTNFIFVAKTPLAALSLPLPSSLLHPLPEEAKNNNQFIWLCCKLLLDSRIQSSSSSSSFSWPEPSSHHQKSLIATKQIAF